ncbi:MAG: ATP-binding cassette domain-containing protein [Alphaproteobacteria bacterium]
MADPVVSLVGVTKRFGDFVAVDDLSFELPRGAIVGFLGPNGAGKTTTVRMMLGILPPDSGRIEIFGRPATRAAHERIGYLPEERGLYRRLRAIDAIVYIALLKGMNAGAARRRGLQLLEEFGLGDFARVRIQGLSKGMSQKVQVITSIIHDPEFVILDEPFSGLDPVNQAELEIVVNNLAAQGKTVLFSTHTMEHAERLCDALVIIAKGRKLFDGTPDEARELLPRRALIEAAEDLSFLSTVKGVVRVVGPEAGDALWEIELAPGADGRALLAACFERGIVPARFEIARPSLREVFVSLVSGHENAVAERAA